MLVSQRNCKLKTLSRVHGVSFEWFVEICDGYRCCAVACVRYQKKPCTDTRRLRRVGEVRLCFYRLWGGVGGLYSSIPPAGKNCAISLVFYFTMNGVVRRVSKNSGSSLRLLRAPSWYCSDNFHIRTCGLGPVVASSLLQ